eukprot:310878-Pleurochrysis_carterae.AAC.1
MRAVVEVPHARRLVLRARDDVFAVGSDADRPHRIAVPLERAHLRASGEGAARTRALSRQPKRTQRKRDIERAQDAQAAAWTAMGMWNE